MQRKWLVPPIAFAIIAIVAIGVFFAQRAYSEAGPGAYTAEHREIIAAIQEYHDVLVQVMVTEDVTLLDEILVDRPLLFRMNLPRGQYAELQRYVALISGPEVATHSFGFLTAMQNRMRHDLYKQALFRDAVALARAENRKLTTTDWARMRERNYGMEIGPRINVDPATWQEVSSSGIHFNEEQFFTIRIYGNRADAYYERVRNWHAILVRIDGKWYITQVL